VASDPLSRRPAGPVLPIWQIGSDGGFLQKPVALKEILMGPAERADVIVDFSHMRVDSELYLINEGPDEPFSGGKSDHDFDIADRASTGQVMKFVIVPLSGRDTSVPPAQLNLPSLARLGEPQKIRKLSLNEAGSSFFDDAPIMALLGTLTPNGAPSPLGWSDEITEHVRLNDIEVWEFYNFTADAHPIHLHEIQFQVVNRQRFGRGAKKPEKWESGYKDTVIAYPGEITRIKGHFNLPGLYVWHCHILEHEDNEMMRPYRVN
jgi:bilirubin oxidase